MDGNNDNNNVADHNASDVDAGRQILRRLGVDVDSLSDDELKDILEDIICGENHLGADMSAQDYDVLHQMLDDIAPHTYDDPPDPDSPDPAYAAAVEQLDRAFDEAAARFPLSNWDAPDFESSDSDVEHPSVDDYDVNHPLQLCPREETLEKADADLTDTPSIAEMFFEKRGQLPYYRAFRDSMAEHDVTGRNWVMIFVCLCFHIHETDDAVAMLNKFNLADWRNNLHEAIEVLNSFKTARRCILFGVLRIIHLSVARDGLVEAMADLVTKGPMLDIVPSLKEMAAYSGMQETVVELVDTLVGRCIAHPDQGILELLSDLVSVVLGVIMHFDDPAPIRAVARMTGLPLRPLGSSAGVMDILKTLAEAQDMKSLEVREVIRTVACPLVQRLRSFADHDPQEADELFVVFGCAP